MTKSRDDHDDQKQADHDPGGRRILKGMGIAGAGAAIADHLWVEAEAAEKGSNAGVAVGKCQSGSRCERTPA